MTTWVTTWMETTWVTAFPSAGLTRGIFLVQIHRLEKSILPLESEKKRSVHNIDGLCSTEETSTLLLSPFSPTAELSIGLLK